MAVTVEGDLLAGATGQGRDPRHHRAHRHRRRHRLDHRVPGSTIRSLSMEGRMTVCNMSIEAGAKAGLIAPDDVTFAYLAAGATPPPVPTGSGPSRTGAARHRRRRSLRQGRRPRRGRHRPPRLVGHQPGPGGAHHGAAPTRQLRRPSERDAARRALDYMGLAAGTPLRDVAVDTGSSGRARTAASRTCGRGRRGRRPQGGSRRPHACRPGSPRRQGPGRGRGLDRSSPPPASTGGSRAARCAWP